MEHSCDENPDPDYSSDSSFEYYYLYSAEEKTIMSRVRRRLLCNDPDLDRVVVVESIKRLNEDSGFNIPTDIDEIVEMKVKRRRCSISSTVSSAAKATDDHDHRKKNIPADIHAKPVQENTAGAILMENRADSPPPAAIDDRENPIANAHANPFQETAGGPILTQNQARSPPRVATDDRESTIANIHAKPVQEAISLAILTEILAGLPLRVAVDDRKNTITNIHANPVQETISGAILRNNRAIDDRKNPKVNIYANPFQETTTGTTILKRKRSSRSPPRAAVDGQENPIQETTTARAIIPAASPPHRGGSRPVLFIRRELQRSDMSDHQCRLSMPCKQVKIDPDDLFTRDESLDLRNSLSVAVKVIDPKNRVYNTNLRLTRAGLSTHCYAIGKPWNDIKKYNNFKAGMVINVLVSRLDSGEICFNLEKERFN